MKNEERRNSYDVVSIPSYESVPTQSESSEQSHNEDVVSSAMVHNLSCDIVKYKDESKWVEQRMNAPTPPVSIAGDLSSFGSLTVCSHETFIYDTSVLRIEEIFNAQLMVVYEQGDIHSALHFLLESLHNPFTPRAVTTVFVEKCIRAEFLARIHDQMKPLSLKISSHLNYRKTLKVINSMKLEVLMIPNDKMLSVHSSPIVVCDCDSSVLGSPPTGVICLRTFSDAHEIIEFCKKDNLLFESVTIWNECVEGLYQLVVSLDCSIFFFNSCNVNLVPIYSHLISGKVHVCITDGFHYETLQVLEKIKVVIFPITSHIWTKSEEPTKAGPAPISFLNS
ncbi:uncharacterized protein LOC111603713 [Drosophila hydei]|uniref:Uncharacterized protein LOC111603713 n=1 Tax=Drosophila hydei TaxID=7224 RepID=A0A6J1MD54_DROHY|nr:uncharacterized protein LOC111603713 [Drosophila hydei]